MVAALLSNTRFIECIAFSACIAKFFVAGLHDNLLELYTKILHLLCRVVFHVSYC